MSSAKKRLLCALLALVLCVSALSFSAFAKTSHESSVIVRVGMYAKFSYIDTRRFSSYNYSASGFDFGYTDGTSFFKLVSVSQKGIVLLPQVNANLDVCDEDRSCSSGSGNIGSYSVSVGSYGSFSAAHSAASGYKNGFVAITDKGFEARFGGFSTAEAASSAAGGKKVCSPKQGAITVVNADNASVILMYEKTSHPFALKSAKGTVRLPMLHRSGNVNNFDYPGFFEYSVESSLLRMVNCVELETYTKCVMSNEIGTGFSEETRKAFAVLARTLPFGRAHRSLGFDVCNASCCQVYHGTYRMSEENNALVDATRGQIVTYNGTPIDVLYHNSNGGKSCSSVAAWGGTEVPYLTTVTLETHENVEEDEWTHVFDQQEFFHYLRSRSAFSALSDDEISVQILGKDPYGSDYITTLSVSDGDGNSITVQTSEDVRKAMGFDSANFSIDYSATATLLTADGIKESAVSGILTSEGYKKFDSFGDSFTTMSGETISPEYVVINGRGKGHGVGFSAVGGETLALSGYSFKYILEYFFNGTKLESLYD